MNNGYEYYYLFGLDIPLEEYGLGRIKQPSINDFLSKDISIDSFYFPFLLVDFMIGQAEDIEQVENLRKEVGSLTFLIDICIETERIEFLSILISNLKFLYGIEDIKLNDNYTISVGDNVSIDNSNFDTLCDVVLEMMKINKESLELKKNTNKELDPVEAMFEEKRRLLREKKAKSKKKNETAISDLANILIHNNKIDYKSVLDMTIYQIKNSYETTITKESVNVNLLHRISPKFETKKDDKLSLWIEKVKISKSTLSQID